MVTGGFRNRVAMEAALAGPVDGTPQPARGDCDLIGLGRPLCWQPDFPRQLLAREVEGIEPVEGRLKFARRGWLSPMSPLLPARILNAFAAQAWFYCQHFRVADGELPDPGHGMLPSLVEYLRDELTTARRMHRAFGD
jgi:hypothetical protein